MAAVIQGLFGGSKDDQPKVVADNDFADFASAPEPTPASFAAPAGTTPLAATATPALPYTKWYNIHERHSLSEFKGEGYILLLLLALGTIHILGTRANRRRARGWAVAHAPVLHNEFALVGFAPQQPGAGDAEGEGLARAIEKAGKDGEVLKEVGLSNFLGYATGRLNVAFLDIEIDLLKRYNPVLQFIENAAGFFFESMPAPVERVSAILYPFDGKEALTVPGLPGMAELKGGKSGYDNFVWAVVHKDRMRQLRDERYDVSITVTKDHPRLPEWATVMSESAEITEAMLTPALVAAVEKAGEAFEHLIITDQPTDQPLSVDETVSKKRVYLSLRLPASGDYEETLPIFTYFIQLADFLVEKAHFRPEVMKKVKGGREDVVKRLVKADTDGKAEERALEREKAKKAKRDKELAGLDAKAQKKFLEKEKEREMKRSMKKGSQKG
ncbi:hypothetical protein VE01_08501 [Pseudogymnoascus verrucosus]|uniref:DUF1682 domain protein n=1 Tax=Pseudogymnoascus verrucosus TaxID=342668 RepID=A0A1B8GDA8_9PEZI|nr:uncharacterized protein VE01_08501 [Pseudogymnoascus verrucosus]OBT93826.1 hypothetical protein VE01_08501 [Pseudogymnoascus verrucosus]